MSDTDPMCWAQLDDIRCKMPRSAPEHQFPGIKSNFHPGRQDDWYYIFHHFENEGEAFKNDDEPRKHGRFPTCDVTVRITADADKCEGDEFELAVSAVQEAMDQFRLDGVVHVEVWSDDVRAVPLFNQGEGS